MNDRPTSLIYQTAQTFSRKAVIISIFFSGIFLFMGMAFLSFWMMGLVDGNASRGWPSVQGKIEDSQVLAQVETGTNLATMYYVDLGYTYTIQGRLMKGKRITLKDYSSADSGLMDQLAARYRPGQSVRVYYDPVNPARSVLETGASEGIWILLLVGAVFTLAGVIIGVVLIRFGMLGTIAWK